MLISFHTFFSTLVIPLLRGKRRGVCVLHSGKDGGLQQSASRGSEQRNYDSIISSIFPFQGLVRRRRYQGSGNCSDVGTDLSQLRFCHFLKQASDAFSRIAKFLRLRIRDAEKMSSSAKTRAI
jgi:hypothetical protein